MFRHNVGERDVAVAALVADPPHLSQHPHGLLARLRLHRVAGEIGVATVTGLKLLLLAPLTLALVLDLVQGVVLVRRGRGGDPQEEPETPQVGVRGLTWDSQRPRPSLIGGLRPWNSSSLLPW